MKKTTLLAASAALALAVFSTHPAKADVGPALSPCLRDNSTLCPVVTASFNFEEDSDRARFDSVGGVLAQEPDGYNVARRAGKIGSYAADFAGNDNSYLRLPAFSSLGPGWWTVSAWIYPDTAGSSGQKQTILANDFKNQGGTHVYLENVSGSLYLKASVTTAELETTIIATSGTSLTVGAWNFVTFGASPFPSISGQAVLFAQANGGTKGTSALTYFPFAVNTETYVGARVSQNAGSRTPLDGGIDQLTFFADALNPLQAQNLHNGGTGISYPFTDPQLAFTVTLNPNATVSMSGDNGYSGGYAELTAADMNIVGGTGSVRWNYYTGSNISGDIVVELEDPPTNATFNWVKVWGACGPVSGGGSIYTVLPDGAPSANTISCTGSAVVNGTGYGAGGGGLQNVYFNANTSTCDAGNCSGVQFGGTSYTTNPATGLAWTYNDIVGLRAKITVYQQTLVASGKSAVAHADRLYVEVNGQYGW